MGDGEKNATLSARPGDGCVSFVIVIPLYKLCGWDMPPKLVYTIKTTPKCHNLNYMLALKDSAALVTERTAQQRSGR